MAQEAAEADGLDPHHIAQRSFPLTARGYDPREVGAFLVRVAAELRSVRSLVVELREREADLCADLDRTEARAEAAEARAAAWFDELDETALTERLGDEAARVVTEARRDAADWRAAAMADATSVRDDARREAERVLADAERRAEDLVAERLLEAAATVHEARARAEQLVADAEQRAKVEADALLAAARADAAALRTTAHEEQEARVEELARRHAALRTQVEQLHAGRARLLEAFALVRETVEAATGELDVALPEARLAARAAARRVESGVVPTTTGTRRAEPRDRAADHVFARLRAEQREARLREVVTAVRAAVRTALADGEHELLDVALVADPASAVRGAVAGQRGLVAAAVRDAVDHGPDLGLPAGGDAVATLATEVADAVMDGLVHKLERRAGALAERDAADRGAVWAAAVDACYLEAAGPALDAVVGHAVRAAAARSTADPTSTTG